MNRTQCTCCLPDCRACMGETEAQFANTLRLMEEVRGE
jgi:hypothetical protein